MKTNPEVYGRDAFH